jgi:hypothetical protein
MKNKITRRQLAGTLLATTAAAQAPPAGAPDELQEARDQNRHSGEALAKVELPQDTEPAFHFSA